MKNSILSCGAIFLLLGNIFAQPQPPDSLWSKTFGGDDDDRCISLQRTSDGGYILAGFTYSFGTGYADFWLVKADEDGDSLWSRTFGGNLIEHCYSVQQTSDGGYILAGLTCSFGAGYGDFWLLKTDENGDSLWSRTFGGYGDDICWSVQQTSDEEYVLGGYTSSFGAGSYDFWLLKTDQNGDSLWSRTYGGNGYDNCYSVQQTTDGGYILAGRTQSFGAGSYNFWLLKTDEDGDSLWSRTFGGDSFDSCHSVWQTEDGGFVLTGLTASFGAGSGDCWLVKTNDEGDSLWSRTYGGNGYDYCNSVQQTSDGGYILAGHTGSFGAGSSDFWLVKTDENGDSLWSRTFGGNNGEVCESVIQTSDEGYILAGSTGSFGAGLGDFWLLKTDPDIVGIEDFPSFSNPRIFSLSPPYPNPFNPMTRITFSLPKGAEVSLMVYDINGREVANITNEFYPAGTHQAVFDGSDLSSGIYFARLTAGDFNRTRKLVLVK